MKSNIIKHFITFFALLASVPALAQFASAPAFPGAEGYGRYTTGGRGGTVYHVTRLDDYIQDKDYSPTYTAEDAIPGTLRYAVTRSGARIVVFDVAGTIELKCPLKIKNGDITILGQTAPGDGICLKNYTFGIDADNVIIRFIRCRMGDEGKRYYKSGVELTGNNQAFEDDAMNAYHNGDSSHPVCNNIIIDHCSLSWCVDECGTFYGNRDFTLQWCMLSESLLRSVHEKGNHGYGGIWGGERASFHHNLLANHDSRNPRFDHGYVSTLAGPVDFTNNVVYNWGNNSAYGGENKAGYEAKKFNMINNYFKPGPYTINKQSTKKNRLLNPTTTCSNCGANLVPGKFYISGNKVNGADAGINTTNINFDSGYTLELFKQNCVLNSRAIATTNDFSQYNTISTHTADGAFSAVVDYVGASYKRDAVDSRICSETKSGTCSKTGSNGSTYGMIDTPSDAGGWPVLTGTAKTDTDGDGIPDEWEDDHGLDKNDASDGKSSTLDSRGYYTNVEVYANSLVEDIVKNQRAGATETFEEYYPIIDGGTGTPDDDDEPAAKIDLVWDFSEFTTQTSENQDDYKGLKLVLNGTDPTKDYISASKGFHGNGGSTASRRYIEYTPSTNGILTVSFRSNNNDDLNRTTGIGTDFDSQIAVADCNAGVVSAHLNSGTKYYVYFVSGGQSITRLEFKNYYTVKTNANGYSTFCAEEATEVPAGLTAYSGQLNAARNAVVLAEVGKTIPKETGVLVQGASSTYYDLVMVRDVNPIENNLFSGTTKRTQTPNATYCMTTMEDGVTAFYLYTGEYIPSNKAYFTMPSEAKAFTFCFDDETSIEPVWNSRCNSTDSTIYNLSGQKVNSSYRGIIIIDGKKYYNR